MKQKWPVGWIYVMTGRPPQRSASFPLIPLYPHGAGWTKSLCKERENPHALPVGADLDFGDQSSSRGARS
jgi:hypothetical protein